MVKPVSRSASGVSLRLITSALRVGRKRININIVKIVTRRKRIPVETEQSWRQFIFTEGDA